MVLITSNPSFKRHYKTGALFIVFFSSLSRTITTHNIAKYRVFIRTKSITYASSFLGEYIYIERDACPRRCLRVLHSNPTNKKGVYGGMWVANRTGAYASTGAAVAEGKRAV